MSFDPNSNAILTDPEYLLKNPGYIKEAHDLLVRYGIIPPAGSGFGSDAATADEVNANPYSVAGMLRKGFTSALGQNTNVANAHGALFSGAFQNNQAHSLDDYNKGISGATSDLLSGLNTISSARTGTLSDIWNRLSNAPVTPDTSAPAPYGGGNPAPNVPGVTTVDVGPNYGGSIQEPTRVPGGGYTPPKKPKPVVGPVLGGRGHVT